MVQPLQMFRHTNFFDTCSILLRGVFLSVLSNGEVGFKNLPREIRIKTHFN